MPNQYSPESRRVSYIEDRNIYEFLEEKAKKQGTSVGELIREAVAAQYALTRSGNASKKVPIAPVRSVEGSKSTIRHFAAVG